MNSDTKKPLGTKVLAYVALALALIVLSAFLKIPLPIPITLQFAVILTLTFLLGEYCAIAVLAYLLMGIVGIPVFSAGGGFAYVFNPTFGYLLGFLFGAFLSGKIANPKPFGNNPSYKRLIFATVIFLAVVYIFGTVYGILIFRLYLQNTASIGVLLTMLVLNGLWKDLLCSVFIVLLAKKLISLIGLKN